MRGPSTLPPGVAYAATGVRGLPRGSYLRAVCILTIRELFEELEEEDQNELLDELVGSVIAEAGAGLANRVRIPGDQGEAPAVSRQPES